MPQKETLLKLQFNQIIIDELWDNKEYYICNYQELEEGTIVLADANVTYLNLQNITKKDIGRVIEEHLDSQDIRQISMLYKKYRDSNECINFVREVPYNSEYSFWNVSVIMEYPYLRCVGRKISHLSSINEGNLEYNINSIKLEDYSSGSILVEKKENGKYKICSSSKMVKDKAFTIKQGEYLDDVLEGYLYWMKTFYILDECIKGRKTIGYFDIFSYEDIRSKPISLPIETTDLIYVVLIPILHVGFTGVLILIKALDNKKIENLEEGNTGKDVELNGENLFGSCVFYNINREYPYISEMNPYFAKHLYEKKLNINAILNSPIIKRAQDRKVAVSGSITFKQKDNIEKKYSMNAVPTIQNGEIEKMLVTLIPKQEIENVNNFMFALLTPREKEVISLVVKGYTNRCIAHELCITEGTVKKVIYNCYQKLGICSRIELVKLLMIK